MLELFDLLELEGEPLLDRPLTERRERLAGLLDRRVETVRSSSLSTTVLPCSGRRSSSDWRGSLRNVPIRRTNPGNAPETG